MHQKEAIQKKEAIQRLVRKFEAQRLYYCTPDFNETMLRSEFLDPLFELLGWDIKNAEGLNTREREVLQEESLRAAEHEYSKKPDYTFRLHGERVFFLEAKKPSVHINKEDMPAKQVRRYGFSAGLKISVLSNFEYLCIYDTTHPVKPEDDHRCCLVKEYHFSQYAECFDELQKKLGRDSVYNGCFYTIWDQIEKNRNLISVDKLFLSQINEWRLILGKQILQVCPNMEMTELGDVVQSYINKILFLRVCEDRNIEEYHRLLSIAKSGDSRALVQKFREADAKYNSGIFTQPLAPNIVFDIKSAFWEIIKQLYYPESPYSFAVLSSDILGRIYEIFVSQSLSKKEGELCIVDKPETGRRDAVTTPKFIINKILEEVLIASKINDLAAAIPKLKFADIACGSGSFLMEVYQLLCDTLLDHYLKHDHSKLALCRNNSYKLQYSTKVRILLNCVYGIDKDYNAVEACKFGLLLKLLEDEDLSSLSGEAPILPSLNDNIFFGNSLLNQSSIPTTDDQESNDQITDQVNPFDFKQLRFDFILGNPPYMKTEDIKKYTPTEHDIYPHVYKTAYKQYDKYFLFIERALQLLNKTGIIGYITPNKFTKLGSAKKLRELITQGKHLYELISLGAHQVFEDKSTYTCLIILTKQPTSSFTYSEVIDFRAWRLGKKEALSTSRMDITSLNENTWILCTDKQRELLNKLLRVSMPLGSLLGEECVFNGIQTSANKIFVIKPDHFDGYNYYFTATNGKRYSIEKEVTKPYFETSHDETQLSSFHSFKSNARVIFPYRKNSKGILKLIPYKTMEKKHPCLYRYLTDMKEDLQKRDIKPTPPKGADEWYRYGRQQSLETCEVKEKLIVGVLSQENKYAVDHDFTLISSGGTAGYCIIYIPPHIQYSIYYIQAILTSKQGEWMASLYGEIFRGGYIARGTKVLKQLPVRTINFEDNHEFKIHQNIVSRQKEIIRLGDRLQKIKGNKRLEIPLERRLLALKKEQQDEINSLYGISESEMNQIPKISEIYAAN